MKEQPQIHNLKYTYPQMYAQGFGALKKVAALVHEYSMFTISLYHKAQEKGPMILSIAVLSRRQQGVGGRSIFNHKIKSCIDHNSLFKISSKIL